jgi:DNA-binding response OmpR family regulator
MPHMSGVDLAEAVRRKYPGLKALLISGYSEDTQQLRGADLAGAAFLQKPFTPRELAEKVRSVLGNN